MLLLFGTTLFLSAALLFAVQPMFGKMVLPLLGGSPSVWNTAMVFYQVALLAGYAYAHLLGRRGSPTPWRALHVVLVAAALLLLPLGVGPATRPPDGAHPVAWLLLLMATTVGAPFILVATTGPLLQRWFAGTRGPDSRDPYFLYAASNVGSMLGLLAYPFLIEPRWTLAEQARAWKWGYALLLVLIGLCAMLSRPRARAETEEAEVPAHAAGSAHLTWRRRLRWLALAFAPSSLMLGVTTHLATDVVSAPLLWILPLAVYLLTFIHAFARRPLVPLAAASRLLVYLVLGLLILLEANVTEPLGFVVALHLAVLAAAGLVCHGSLAADRPEVGGLTEFYLWMAAGGALGGVFNALIAPHIFTSVAEYPLALVVCCLLAPAWPARRRGPIAATAPDPGTSAVAQPTPARPAESRAFAGVGRDVIAAVLFGAGVAAVLAGARAARFDWTVGAFMLFMAISSFPLFAFRRRPIRFGLGLAGVMFIAPHAVGGGIRLLHAERSFFGIHRVDQIRDERGVMHRLVHGTTVHGSQWTDPDRCDEPLGYYHRMGPAGQIFTALAGPERARSVGLAGLGSGSLSAYAVPGQRWTYFEIDPAVVRIASTPAWFCFLSASAVHPEMRLGDARLSLAADTTRYDLLVLDAYTSDAIPVHLINREAVRLYLSRLTPHGVLALHLSNRYFDLAPVAGRLARDAALACRIRTDTKISEAESKLGRIGCRWAVLARSDADLAPLTEDPRWERPPTSGPLWTDDFSSLVSVLRVRRGAGVEDSTRPIHHRAR